MFGKLLGKKQDKSSICSFNVSKARQVVCSQYHMMQVLQEEMIVAQVCLGKRMKTLELSSSLCVQLSVRWQCATKLCHSLLSAFRATEAPFSLIKMPKILILFESFIPRTGASASQLQLMMPVQWQKAMGVSSKVFGVTQPGIEPTTFQHQPVYSLNWKVLWIAFKKAQHTVLILGRICCRNVAVPFPMGLA